MYIFIYIYIFMYVYDSQIVHPTPQCLKSFYPVYFVNDF